MPPGGLLYLVEFGQTWHQAEYRRRYLADQAVTGELGSFVARDERGVALYVARHFSQQEIVELVYGAGLDIARFRHRELTTRSGNVIDGFELIARPV